MSYHELSFSFIHYVCNAYIWWVEFVRRTCKQTKESRDKEIILDKILKVSGVALDVLSLHKVVGFGNGVTSFGLGLIAYATIYMGFHFLMISLLPPQEEIIKWLPMMLFVP